MSYQHVKGGAMKSRLSICLRYLPGLLALALFMTTLPGMVFAQDTNGPPWLRNPDPQSIGPIRQAVRKAMEVHKRHSPFLLDTEGVVATGTGIGPGGEPVIKVFTARRGIRGIPRMLEDVAVDVNVSGRIYALADLVLLLLVHLAHLP